MTNMARKLLFAVFLLFGCEAVRKSADDDSFTGQYTTPAEMKMMFSEVMSTLNDYKQTTEQQGKEMEKLQNIVERQSKEIVSLKTSMCRLSPSAERNIEDCDTILVENGAGIKRTFYETRTQRATTSRGIAFYAQLSADHDHIGNHQAMIFDRVRTNIGNAYNNRDGVFTAPSPGIYVFFWTTVNKDHSHMQTELVVNGVQFGRAWADSWDHIDYSMASNTVIVSLKTGDTVWIRSDTVHSAFTSGQNFATFSGWLLPY